VLGVIKAEHRASESSTGFGVAQSWWGAAGNSDNSATIPASDVWLETPE
jgi:hypothetical protein